MKAQRLLMATVPFLLLPATFLHAYADFSPGQTIDKTNWEKGQSLLPEAVLNWVKKGDFILQTGALDYKPAEFFPPHALKSFENNAGKFELDGEDGIIDVATQKLPNFIEGIPFPEIQPSDPKAGQQLLYDKNYNVYSMGGLRYPFQYYNYGTQYLWIDAETFFPIDKVIHDRAGQYWKVMLISTAGAESEDKAMRFMLVSTSKTSTIPWIIPSTSRT
ncbi:MAG: hypothetical protein AB1640_07575 [bacterium]